MLNLYILRIVIPAKDETHLFCMDIISLYTLLENTEQSKLLNYKFWIEIITLVTILLEC